MLNLQVLIIESKENAKQLKDFRKNYWSEEEGKEITLMSLIKKNTLKDTLKASNRDFDDSIKIYLKKKIPYITVFTYFKNFLF